MHLETTKAERLSKEKNVVNTLRRLVSLAESGSAVDGTLDFEAEDDQENTAVHYAAQLGCCRSVVPVLPLPPASDLVSKPNKFGITPLHVAADRGLHDEVKVSICYPCAYFQRSMRIAIIFRHHLTELITSHISLFGVY